MSTAIDADLVERFARDLETVWPEGSAAPPGGGFRFPDDGKALVASRSADGSQSAPSARKSDLCVAVSGGPDSLALLLLAHAAFPAERLRAVTVDHGLRPESAEEAHFVSAICADLGIRHEVLRVEVAGGNLQQAAREARYSAISDWMAGFARSGDALATAHHADDQAETLLMRLNRGSGLAGLAGVRPKRWLFPNPNCAIALVRPLLGWRKSELESVVAAAGIEPARDPSNENEDFDRVRMRNALADADFIDPLKIAESAQLLAGAWQMVEVLAAREKHSLVKAASDGPGFDFSPGAYPLANIEIVRDLIADMGGAVSRSEVSRMCSRLWSGEKASLGGVLAEPCEHFDEEEMDVVSVWKFRPEPPRRTG